MDSFLEEVVVKRKRGLEGLLYALSWVMLVLFGLYAFLQLQNVTLVLSTEGFSTSVLIYAAQLVIFGGAAVLLFLRKDQIKMEYEYTFTNGQMDFAQVFNN